MYTFRKTSVGWNIKSASSCIDIWNNCVYDYSRSSETFHIVAWNMENRSTAHFRLGGIDTPIILRIAWYT